MTNSPDHHIEIWPVPPVPFTDRLEVDSEALYALNEFYVAKGATGLFLLAFSGEGLELNTEQRLLVCRRSVEQLRGRMQVVVGGNFTGSLDEQIDRINRIAATGPDAVVLFLSTLPDGNRLIDDLLTIAERTHDVPLGLYECPLPEHRLLTPAEVGLLAESGRFVFMKETSRDRVQFRAKLRATAGSPLKLYQANFGQLPMSLEDGARGFCGIVASVFPELVNRYCNDSSLSARTRERLYDTLRAGLEAATLAPYPASLKYALKLRGLSMNSHSLMQGGEPINGSVQQSIERTMIELGLLEDYESLFLRLTSDPLTETDLAHGLRGPLGERWHDYPEGASATKSSNAADLSTD